MEVLLWWLISRSNKPTQNHKKFLEIWNSSQITLQMCVLHFGVRILTLGPNWWKNMKKFKDLSRKSYLEAWNPSQFIKFVIINTSNSFLHQNLIKHFLIWSKKNDYFSLNCPIRWRCRKRHIQLKSWT